MISTQALTYLFKIILWMKFKCCKSYNGSLTCSFISIMIIINTIKIIKMKMIKNLLKKVTKNNMNKNNLFTIILTQLNPFN